MTNTEAIKKLERQKMMFLMFCNNCVHPQMVGWCENHCQIPEAYDMAINALKAQEKSQEVYNNSPEPSVQPQRMRAKWIVTTSLQEGQITWRDYKCSNCSHHRRKPMNFCEVCGAEMLTEGEE